MHNEHLKVENEADLVRDPLSGAILNINNSAAETYLERRRRMMMDRKMLEQNAQDIQALKEEMNDIKGLLNSILSAVQK